MKERRLVFLYRFDIIYLFLLSKQHIFIHNDRLIFKS